MNVPSWEFLAFAAVVALAINISAAPRWRQTVLFVANVGFFVTLTREPVALLPFAGLLALGFGSVKLLERDKQRGAFVVALIALIAAFFWLKQYVFVPKSTYLPFAYVTIGMSYVFFRILHLVIDTYQNVLTGRLGLIQYLNYSINFTSLVSGPIQSYPDYSRYETTPAALDARAAADAVSRIILGFFKVSVVSPILLSIEGWAVQSFALQNGALETALMLSAIVALYPMYLYANFSGYTDFVIGVARFLRLELPENFNKPFMALGFIEFWGRWHMTLSNWLKTYVYNPLFMNFMRRFPAPSAEMYLGVSVYFVTFFLVGIWHGATVMFLIFGIFNGLGVSANKLYQILMIRRLGRKRYSALCSQSTYASFSRGLTYTWFAITLVLFWTTPQQLTGMLAHAGIGGTLAALLLVLAAASICLAACKSAGDELQGAPAVTLFALPYVRTVCFTILAAITISATLVLNAPAPHVVYKGF